MSMGEQRLHSWMYGSGEHNRSIGQRIKELRESRGLTLTELAAQAGVAKSYLSNIERQVQSNPSMLFLQKVCAVFNMEVEGLWREVDEPYRPDPEWFELIREAAESGVDKEELRSFINYQRFKQRSQQAGSI